MSGSTIGSLVGTSDGSCSRSSPCQSSGAPSCKEAWDSPSHAGSGACGHRPTHHPERRSVWAVRPIAPQAFARGRRTKRCWSVASGLGCSVTPRGPVKCCESRSSSSSIEKVTPAHRLRDRLRCQLIKTRAEAEAALKAFAPWRLRCMRK